MYLDEQEWLNELKIDRETDRSTSRSPVVLAGQRVDRIGTEGKAGKNLKPIIPTKRARKSARF